MDWHGLLQWAIPGLFGLLGGAWTLTRWALGRLDRRFDELLSRIEAVAAEFSDHETECSKRWERNSERLAAIEAKLG